MRRVCIVGVGLIGGSLGMALRRVRRQGKRKYRVLGLGRSRAALRLAKKRGALDEYALSPAQVIPQADIVVLCVPVHHIARVLQILQPHFKKGAILTDVGSVKNSVHSQVNRIVSRRKDIHFIGGHPLAGSEKTGVLNSKRDLFNKATIVLTKNGASPSAFNEIKNMWNDVGGRCALLSSMDHDRILSLTSHLPHLLAFSLFWLTQMAVKKNPIIKSLVAGSFRDMTRIAASDHNVWTGILKLNREPIKKITKDFLTVLNRLVATPEAKLDKTLRSITFGKKAW